MDANFNKPPPREGAHGEPLPDVRVLRRRLPPLLLLHRAADPLRLRRLAARCHVGGRSADGEPDERESGLARRLVPLRRELKLQEVFISARVASSKHDAERFNAYLTPTSSPGRRRLPPAGCSRTISSLPSPMRTPTTCAPSAIKLAVCDVYGSMSGLPMDVCVAHSRSTSSSPARPVARTRDHLERTPTAPSYRRRDARFIRYMDWGMNTDLQAVFDQILEVAVASSLSPEKMVRRVVVFTDMEFDHASSRLWEMDSGKFAAAGYGGDAVAEVVFWNMRDSGKAVPVTSGQKGVALVSGFSKNLLKLFLDGDMVSLQ
uniref:DUF7788 domain-containing protein n=1 Tax=Leersia perrieri TaxID=77586 RepID=A0A0D9VZQ7_9ORYZ